MLAHELRNPLAPIRNALQILTQAGLDDHTDWCLGVIDRQTAHLTRLVDDLLDISRISRGVIELRMESLDLLDILSRAVETSRPLIKARRHRFERRMPREPVRIEGDLVRLTQVVSNLLTNAAKFTDEGGCIELIAATDGDEVVIRVRDSGRGIDAEGLSRLFELFYQVDRTMARTEGGLGIGLSLVKRLVEMHGGRVSVQSAGLGRGSEFSVRLPCRPGVAERPGSWRRGGEPREALAAPAPDHPGLRILIVDDNRDAIDSLQLLLDLEGHRVLVAYDGESALKLAVEERPEVVLLDIGLPGMDGYAVARALRARTDIPAPRIIGLTGYGQPDSRAKSKAAGFDVHLVKPIDFEALLVLLSARRESDD